MYLSKPFFSQRYALYTAVVKAYDNQQSSNNTTLATPAAETQTTETTEEGKE
jgi:hypothetical protein